MDQPAIEVRAVCKSYGDARALEDFSLTLPRGNLLGFVGPNGSGKSTCLRILVGLVKPDSGTVKVLGHDPRRDPLAVRRACSYLPGEVSVYHQMTGQQFLDFALGFYPGRSSIGADLAERFALPLTTRIRAYSAGMKQKLALVSTLTPDVDLYVLDEPDRALDASARIVLRETLTALRDDGKSVLLSSHHLGEVDALADATAFVLNGRTIPDERVAEARQALRNDIRLRLDGQFELPKGYQSATPQPDGSVLVRTTGEPLRWLASLPAERVVSAEVGATRLEDVYRELTEVAEPQELNR